MGAIIMFKKTILFDLDGVLNTYDGKYDKNNIPPIKDGAYKLIKELSDDYKIVIFTTRNSLIASKWVIENDIEPAILSRIENLKQDIKIGVLIKIANGFNMTPSEFLSEFEKD